ncbi:hypothetical protein Nepgr_026754 [Nepenthes gracilis]|uniref:Pentatricopeptide repeat-containing protein n=1 Tax=Nepenthes gracilis TaxID=150966 RepID=A0AAD3T945_NEPGR|nr:hypothetical protein Nepgr_026754 [Nepenthes gracilis]
MRKGAALKSVLHSICHAGMSDNALKLTFTDQIPLDPLIYSEFLQLSMDRNAQKQGRLIHGRLILNGLDLDLTLNNKLIMFYAKTGDMANARKVFEIMPKRNVVSWTGLLSGYSQNELFEDALIVFYEMHHSGGKANQFTYSSALRACTKLICLRSGKQIQGCLQKSRFIWNLFVQSALVDFHSKLGAVEDARYIFEKMSERDLVCWNCMIGGYAVQGFINDSFRMFQSMLREGMLPDYITSVSLLSACNQGLHLLKVCQLHAFMVQIGLECYDCLSGLLIDAYAKCGSIKSSYHVFKSMPQKDVMSCTAMINGYACEPNHCRDALNLFFKIHQSGMLMDDVLLCSMLNICANIVSLSLGKQIHALVLKNQPQCDVAIGNSLIDMYAKCGELEEANHAFDMVEEKNVISWSSLIGGYAKHGYGCKAFAIYKRMEHEGLKPNEITFLSLLFACSHNGLISNGWDFFISMISKYNIAPRGKHYSCMIDLFARGGQLEEALCLTHKMNIEPNASLWSAILGACNIYGNLSVGKVAASRLFQLDPANSANYVVLSSLYAAVGLWDDAWTTRGQMEKKCLKKDPGCSFSLLPKNGPELLQS